MVDFIQNCLDGIMLGSSYALLAIGFTLIFGVMRRLNLSYGPSIMVGAFVGTLVYVEFKANAVAIAAATVVGAVIAGIYVERLCFRAIRQGAAAASMVSSFVIWMQLEESVTVVFPDRTYPFPPLVTAGPVELGPFFFKLENVVMFACAVVMTVWLHWLLQRTRFGLAVRAVSEDPRAARFMGINVSAVMFLAFAIASAFGGVAAYLIVSRGRPDHPAIRPLGHVQGADRHDAGRHGLDPRRHPRWVAAGRRRSPEPLVSGRRV